MLMFLSEDMTREDSAPDSLGVNMLKTHMEMDADLVDKNVYTDSTKSFIPHISCFVSILRFPVSEKDKFGVI